MARTFLTQISLPANPVSPLQAATKSYVDAATAATNVRDPAYGAVGDGVANDSAAVNSALTALPAGSQLYFPPGTYNISGITTLNKDVTISGAGNRTSVINVGSSAYGFQYSGAGTANVTFRDIGFTGSTSAQILLYGTTVTRALFRDCRFSGFTGDAIQTLGARLSCLRCEFTSDGSSGTKTGVEALQGPQEVTLRQCHFRYLNRGLYCSDSGGAAAHVTLEGNFLDGGWMYLKSTYGNNGATVTYTATVLTDTGAAFGAISPLSTVRAMALKQSGTAAQAYQAVINDAAANFVTAGVKTGDIVRTATLWGVVSEVVSATSLYIEEWLNLSDYTPASTPTAAVGYTIYGLVLGRVQSNTATTVTVDAWRDWDGNLVTPSAGTAYEIAPKGDYQCYVYRAQRVRITNNTIRRAWSDSISAQTVRDVIIANNNIYDTQDVGITCGQPSGETSIAVIGNRISHAGTAGIWIGYGHDSEIIGNIINTSNWMSLASTGTYGGIMVEDSQRMDISHNTVIKGLSPNGTEGIHLVRRTGTADSIVLKDNSTNGYPADVKIEGAVTNVSGTFQPNSIVSLLNGAVGPRGSFSGTGVPAIPASPGSTFLRTDGAAGATSYVKETASSSTVWTVAASVTYGTTAGTAAQGNDTRITGAEQTTNKGAASGYAGLTASSQVATVNLPSATATVQGINALAGDLSGTSAAPTVPGLAGKAPLASPTFTGTATLARSVNTPVTVAYAATITPDASLGNQVRVTAVSAAMTVNVPTSGVDGQRILFELTATAAVTVTFAAGFEVGTVVASRAVSIVSGRTAYIGVVNRGGTYRLLAVDPG